MNDYRTVDTAAAAWDSSTMVAPGRTVLIAALSAVSHGRQLASIDGVLRPEMVSAARAVENAESYLRNFGFNRFNPSRELIMDLYQQLGLYKPAALWVRNGPKWEIQERSLRHFVSVAGENNHNVVDVPDLRLYYEIMPIVFGGLEYAVAHACYDDGYYGALVSYWRSGAQANRLPGTMRNEPVLSSAFRQ